MRFSLKQRLAPRNDLSRRIAGNSAYGVNPSPVARAVAADDHILLANIQDAFSIGVKTLPRVELAVLDLILPVVCLIHPPIVHSLVPPRQSGKLFRFTARPSRFDPCLADVCTDRYFCYFGAPTRTGKGFSSIPCAVLGEALTVEHSGLVFRVLGVSAK